MVFPNGRISFLCPSDARTMQNQPTSTADSASEDMPAEADEPPDPRMKSVSSSDSIAPRTTFMKSSIGGPMCKSLLTRILHNSESDSHVDEDDYAFYEPNRALSSASTYSRSSAVSITELTSDGGHTSPRSHSPSPARHIEQTISAAPIFRQNPFQSESTTPIPRADSVDPKNRQGSDEASEQKVAADLGRKRCISFACVSKEPELPKRAATMVEEAKKEAPAPRKCSLKFICPSRSETPAAAPIVSNRPRLGSPPPPSRRLNPSPKQIKAHRGSDSTVRTNSPKIIRKLSTKDLRRRGSVASDISETEATRFHEFASSKHEDDDWVKESTCFQRRLTVDDTLAIENGLRKLGQEAEEELEDEDAEEVIEDDDEEEDEDVDEDVEDGAEDDSEDEEVDTQQPAGYVSDEGFQTDDEHGFAHSDDESDGGSDYDWWAPGRAAVRENLERLRPAQRRRNSDSSIESEVGGIAISPKLRRKRSRPMEIQAQPFELPDSTDFVCGTLDEDKPLEQAFINHLNQRRAAKHKFVPQDIDPTFPASDPEIDDEEEDEVSEHAATESDHPLFHGQMDMQEDSERMPRRLIPKKRSPLGSPRRLRSPPPAKKTQLSHIHRSPPPPARRARSPAPCALYSTRLSSSVPRRRSKIHTHVRIQQQIPDVDEDDNTPRFNRGAIDIVRGLEKKRQRRHEKLLEKHCRKAGKSAKHPPKKVAPGKGAEKMRDLGIGLNEYRGRKCAEDLTAAAPGQDDVHMLSY